MNYPIKLVSFILLLFAILPSCSKKERMTVSNKLTTFIHADKILEQEDQKKLIEKSSGNPQRDAVKIINSDLRTKGYYKNLLLVNSEIYPTSKSYTFSGIVASTINEYPANATQQIVVTIEEQSDNLYYELSFGSNP